MKLEIALAYSNHLRDGTNWNHNVGTTVFNWSISITNPRRFRDNDNDLFNSSGATNFNVRHWPTVRGGPGG